MALFSLTDILIKPDSTRNFQALNSYDTDNKRYPIDLGSTDKGHYMMFFIKVQKRTQFQANYDTSNAGLTVQKNNNNSVFGALYNNVSALKKAVSSTIGNVINNSNNEVARNVSNNLGKVTKYKIRGYYIVSIIV